MLHPQLQQQLAALGLDTTTPPDPQIWSRLLAEISSNYSEHDATEASLADNELFFETMYKTSYHQALQLTLLYKLRTALDSKLDLNEVIRTAVEETADMLGYGLASLYLIENDELILQHQVGYSEVEAIDRLPITRGVMGRVARTDKHFYIEDVN
ncbi:MAG: GAF domain-containing protein [Anaerolineae bacterium]